MLAKHDNVLCLQPLEAAEAGTQLLQDARLPGGG